MNLKSSGGSKQRFDRLFAVGWSGDFYATTGRVSSTIRWRKRGPKKCMGLHASQCKLPLSAWVAALFLLRLDMCNCLMQYSFFFLQLDCCGAENYTDYFIPDSLWYNETVVYRFLQSKVVKFLPWGNKPRCIIQWKKYVASLAHERIKETMNHTPTLLSGNMKYSAAVSYFFLEIECTITLITYLFRSLSSFQILSNVCQTKEILAKHIFF